MSLAERLSEDPDMEEFREMDMEKLIFLGDEAEEDRIDEEEDDDFL